MSGCLADGHHLCGGHLPTCDGSNGMRNVSRRFDLWRCHGCEYVGDLSSRFLLWCRGHGGHRLCGWLVPTFNGTVDVHNMSSRLDVWRRHWCEHVGDLSNWFVLRCRGHGGHCVCRGHVPTFNGTVGVRAMPRGHDVWRRHWRQLGRDVSGRFLLHGRRHRGHRVHCGVLHVDHRF